MPLHINTPLLESLPLSAITRKHIWLKMDALQPSGSFKIRGVGLACEEYARQGKTRFVSSSGGNAGIAVAYAGRKLGLPVVVVVPESTSERACALIREQQATLVVQGATWAEANTHALSLLNDSDAFIHPFDDPLLWQGHASIIDEVAAEAMRPDAIVLSVGGGGLFAGVMEGLQRNGWADMPVITVETDGTASLARAVEQRDRVTLPTITGVATSLGAKQVCEQAFSLAMSHPVSPAVVTDRQAVQACRRFIDDHRVLIEPACGASLALVYEASHLLNDYENILVIVCGGVTASVEQVMSWTETH
ncbi:pyridoxal-phosphate dependent enzyme [Allopusillimonas ginsengisoli]|uniref:pyridoxal-phosphate dependent enzyme n=1 Tax=Allopusillimonas ginsengisoli TaxID=453575 RepID=UPI001022029F|nr:pyridoxal-phosphate dependent enzyme [Allopusillimonas ginsengisoli]TEA78899.1 pyridoxal-phosphate dependent enzyme [Allopusillimonas ginsengisoli]